MSIINKSIKVQIKKITSFAQEKRMDGFMFIKGICQATTEDESFEFDFDYKGKSSEDKSKLINYLENKAQQFLINKRNKNNTNTLGDLIHELMNEKPKCNHMHENGFDAIVYDSSYEMRSSDMHCELCGKEGSREELEKDRL